MIKQIFVKDSAYILSTPHTTKKHLNHKQTYPIPTYVHRYKYTKRPFHIWWYVRKTTLRHILHASYVTVARSRRWFSAVPLSTSSSFFNFLHGGPSFTPWNSLDFFRDFAKIFAKFVLLSEGVFTESIGKWPLDNKKKYLQASISSYHPK